jgi:ribosomal protein L7/L12
MEITISTRSEAHKIARELLYKEHVLGDNALDHAIVNSLLDALGFPKYDIDTGYPEDYNGLCACAYGCLGEKTEFDVILTDHGQNRLRIIRWVRENTDLSLAKSRELVDNLPQIVKKYVGESEANYIKQLLESLGAEVEIK